MTFYKELASAQRDEDTVTAYEKTEKFSAAKSYEIVVSRDGIARLVFPTARTTWKKKFKELAEVSTI